MTRNLTSPLSLSMVSLFSRPLQPIEPYPQRENDEECLPDFYMHHFEEGGRMNSCDEQAYHTDNIECKDGYQAENDPFDLVLPW